MSHTQFSQAPTARQARQFTAKLTAQLTGRSERGPDRKVRRGSVDVDDRRAQVFRPIGDGTTAGALSWIDCLLTTMKEWDRKERKKGGARPLGHAGVAVLETLLGRRGTIAIDFRTGRLDPALETIARVAGVAKTTVVRALARLKAMKILSWIRRTQRTGNDGQYGPQREQISNAYFFTPEALPARVLQRLRDLVSRRALRRKASSSPPTNAPPPPASSELRDVLARMRAGIEAREQASNASPPSGQYPRSGFKG